MRPHLINHSRTAKTVFRPKSCAKHELFDYPATTNNVSKYFDIHFQDIIQASRSLVILLLAVWSAKDLGSKG